MRAQREPFFNAPWPVLALVAALVSAFAVQAGRGVDAAADRFGFSPGGLDAGRYDTVLTALFLHGSWAHCLINSAFVVAFGAPVSRRFGLDVRGVFAFLIFFLACGGIANLGFAAAHPHSAEVVVGASGAAAGLMAAASRLMWRGPGLAPFLSSPVVGMAAAWTAINAVIAITDRLGLAAMTPGAGGAPVAWEAHIVGYAAGLLLFSPMLRFLAGEPTITD